MNSFIKSFISILKRNKLASFLNIAGLSISLAAFLIIMMQIQYEWTFDKIHPKAGRIFRIDMPKTVDLDPYAAAITRGFADQVFSSSPHIEAGSLIQPFSMEAHFTVEDGTSKKGFSEVITTCYPDLIHIFGFTLVEGDSNCLKDPEKILIPQSMAKRFYGNAPAVGKTIQSQEKIWTKSDIKAFTVGGVYKDFPENTQLNNTIYTAMDNSMVGNWVSMSLFGYVLLDDSNSKEGVEKTINASIDFKSHDLPEETRLELIPLTDIYYLSGQITDVVKVGNPNHTRLLLLVALLVITIACINFINFSTALAPVRMKSIHTQMVLGNSIQNLRSSLVFESIAISLLSCFLSVLLVWGLHQTEALSFVAANTNILLYPHLIITLFLLSVLLGIVSGIYPTWYMTSFPSAIVLKGSFGLSQAGRRLRTSLIGFQFVISITLIIFTLFIQLQNKYMQAYDSGFNKERLTIVKISNEMYHNNKDIYVQKLKAEPGIEDVAFCDQLLGRSDTYMMNEINFKDELFVSYVLNVSGNFLRLMHIPVVTGQDFPESQNKVDSTTYYIFDQGLQSTLDMEPGNYVEVTWNKNQGRIIGFIDNLKISSLRKGKDDLAFVVGAQNALPYSYIRFHTGADIQKTVNHIRNVIAEIEPTYPVHIEFYDHFHEQLYQKELTLNKMITSFSLLAIILSIVGVFGLVLFETQYRKKEIGIRKVFGATVQNILMMLNRVYLRILSVCFIIAAPLAFYLVNDWLTNFFYRTSIHWWVFAIAFAIVTCITLLTVSFQSWRASHANPVDSIKTQ